MTKLYYKDPRAIGLIAELRAHLKAANKGAEYASNFAHGAYKRSFRAEDKIAELELKIEALNDTNV